MNRISSVIDCPMCKRRLLQRSFRNIFGSRQNEAHSDDEAGLSSDFSPVDNDENLAPIEDNNIIDLTSNVAESTLNVLQSPPNAMQAKNVQKVRSVRVHLKLAKMDGADSAKIRRSNRALQPVQRLNYGMIKCCVCQKSFYRDISAIQYDDGAIICSFECCKSA